MGGDMDPAHVEAVCEAMHDAYEIAAVTSGWETNPASRKPWSDVPKANQETMRSAVRAILTSADPAIHAAFLAALVRAGIGEVQWRVAGRAGRVQRRYVTRWEDVDA